MRNQYNAGLKARSCPPANYIWPEGEITMNTQCNTHVDGLRVFRFGRLWEGVQTDGDAGRKCVTAIWQTVLAPQWRRRSLAECRIWCSSIYMLYMLNRLCQQRAVGSAPVRFTHDWSLKNDASQKHDSVLPACWGGFYIFTTDHLHLVYVMFIQNPESQSRKCWTCFVRKLTRRPSQSELNRAVLCWPLCKLNPMCSLSQTRPSGHRISAGAAFASISAIQEASGEPCLSQNQCFSCVAKISRSYTWVKVKISCENITLVILKVPHTNRTWLKYPMYNIYDYIQYMNRTQYSFLFFTDITICMFFNRLPVYLIIIINDKQI